MYINKIRTLASLTMAVGLCLAVTENATAATLSYEETASGITGSGAGTDYFQLPVSDRFGNTLGQASGTLGAPADPGFTFYDDYIFTVASSTVDAASFLLNDSTFAISDLQMRLYSTTGNTLPVLGDSPEGLQADWSNPISTNNSQSNLATTMLSAGTYVLEVRGDVTGQNGGSYTGIINLQPVPLPAALPLLLSGLGLLGGGFARKRRG
jgi:hypothetical protein